MKKLGKKDKKVQQLNKVIELFNINGNVTKSAQEMCEELGVKYTESVGRYYRNKLQELGITQNVTRIEDTKEYQKAKDYKMAQYKDFYLFTWAQSQTRVNVDFWRNLNAFKDYLDAGLHVIAGRYKNPTSLEANVRTKGEEFWDKEVTPYLDANKQMITKKLLSLANVKIQPTAKTPLNSMSSLSGENSAIIGHPSIHFDSTAVLKGQSLKVLATTGACTVPNYTDTKAGVWAEAHHEYGFILVEIDRELDQFYLHQIQAEEDGTFYFLNLKVKDGKVFKHEESIPLAVFGDTHYGINHCETSIKAGLELCEKLNVQKNVQHDLFDGYTINPHDRLDPFVQMELEHIPLSKEIGDTLDFVRMLSTKFKRVYSVNSNHNDFLDRWLINNDWRKNRNRKEYLDLASLKASHPEASDKGVFHLLVDELGLSNVTTFGHSDSYKIKGWEIAMHYDRGANGSRGSINQFKNLGIKSIGGHGHTPKRAGNAIMVGTMTVLRQGYNKGLSSWGSGLVLVYPNGKASHVLIINGKYTTMKL